MPTLKTSHPVPFFHRLILGKGNNGAVLIAFYAGTRRDIPEGNTAGAYLTGGEIKNKMSTIGEKKGLFHSFMSHKEKKSFK